uniref:Uncharacterized protein n=1 Tax=Pseudomonas putida (strain ATCC 700007 / DSM 6899 / JCM 31910 / BCRC 17059 / LMG 24140 / F1) TaxID=351746 RepID=A5W5A6_PSEP1
MQSFPVPSHRSSRILSLPNQLRQAADLALWSVSMKSKNLLRAALVAALVSALSGCWMFMPPGGGGGHGGGGHGGGFGGHQGGGPR